MGALNACGQDADPTRSPRRTELTTESPLWVGAWWVGFLGAGAAAFLIAIPILGYPRQLPGGCVILSSSGLGRAWESLGPSPAGGPPSCRPGLAPVLLTQAPSCPWLLPVRGTQEGLVAAGACAPSDSFRSLSPTVCPAAGSPTSLLSASWSAVTVLQPRTPSVPTPSIQGTFPHLGVGRGLKQSPWSLALLTSVSFQAPNATW